MLRPDVLNFLDVASAFIGGSELDIVTEQVLVGTNSPLRDRTLEQARIRQAYGVIVLVIEKASGAMVFSPAADMRSENGDVLIAIGERSQLTKMAADVKVQESGSGVARS
jgi:K+/H+ antiporter YhaU regulatory subunit KhtT